MCVVLLYFIIIIEEEDDDIAGIQYHSNIIQR